MAARKKQTKFQKKLKKFKKRYKKFMSNNAAVIAVAVLFLIVLFFAAFFITTAIVDNSNQEPISETTTADETTTLYIKPDTTTKVITTEAETTTEAQQTTAKPQNNYTPGNTDYPDDTASWKLICVNKNRYVSSDVEEKIKLSYVAGSGERMDSRAAEAYEEMYSAAKADGYYLTPCSGYRSYSTQKRLYNEFYFDYINQGYSSQEAHNLTSRRRNPAGSSEHNLGICMDIICAASSANFQNTDEYKWLCDNAADYGFILRYPEDKVDITGVKFEPWHWRYVGVENAASIKASGLCLEEYLGLA